MKHVPWNMHCTFTRPRWTFFSLFAISTFRTPLNGGNSFFSFLVCFHVIGIWYHECLYLHYLIAFRRHKESFFKQISKINWNIKGTSEGGVWHKSHAHMKKTGSKTTTKKKATIKIQEIQYLFDLCVGWASFLPAGLWICWSCWTALSLVTGSPPPQKPFLSNPETGLSQDSFLLPVSRQCLSPHPSGSHRVSILNLQQALGQVGMSPGPVLPQEFWVQLVG